MQRFIDLLQRRIWLGPLILLVVFVIGLALGLIAGWETVSFKASADDVVAAADSYSLNNDLALARERLASLSRPELQRILTNLIVADNANEVKQLEAQRLTALAQALGLTIGPGAALTTSPATTPAAGGSSSNQPYPAPPGSGGLPGGLIILVLLLLLALAIIGAGVFLILRVLPRLQGSRTARPSTGARGAPPAESAWEERAPPAPAAGTTGGGLGHFVPQYSLGNDNYDTSYSLETPHGEFLGECGMGISETIGEGKPDKVTAFDLWLFDKADVRTVTQILMSEYAYNDQTLRTKLATKGEAVLAEKGKTIKLETQSLSISAQIVELIYASNSTYPANSHFQKLIVEIVPTIKDGASH